MLHNYSCESELNKIMMIFHFGKNKKIKKKNFCDTSSAE